MVIVILEFDCLIELLNAVRYEHSPEVPPTDMRITLQCLEIVNELLMLCDTDCTPVKDQIPDNLLHMVLKARRIMRRTLSPCTPLHFRMVDTLGTVAIRIE